MSLRLQLGAKRLIDIVVSLVGLALTWPIILICGAIVRHYFPGPLLLRQGRVGRNGKLFVLYKVRTMLVGWAPEQSHEHPELPLPVRAIRRAQFDELPNLFNVLLGHLSFVGGTRPLLPAEHYARFGDCAAEASSFRPAMICLYGIDCHHKSIGDTPANPVLHLDSGAIRRVREYQNGWSLRRDWEVVQAYLPLARRAAAELCSWQSLRAVLNHVWHRLVASRA